MSKLGGILMDAGAGILEKFKVGTIITMLSGGVLALIFILLNVGVKNLVQPVDVRFSASKNKIVTVYQDAPGANILNSGYQELGVGGVLESVFTANYSKADADKISASTGVSGVSALSLAPVNNFSAMDKTFNTNPLVVYVDPSFFKITGLSLASGQLFSNDLTGAIIGNTAAKNYFGYPQDINLTTFSLNKTDIKVFGVLNPVANINYGLGLDLNNVIFIPHPDLGLMGAHQFVVGLSDSSGTLPTSALPVGSKLVGLNQIPSPRLLDPNSTLMRLSAAIYLIALVSLIYSGMNRIWGRSISRNNLSSLLGARLSQIYTPMYLAAFLLTLLVYVAGCIVVTIAPVIFLHGNMLIANWPKASLILGTLGVLHGAGAGISILLFRFSHHSG